MLEHARNCPPDQHYLEMFWTTPLCGAARVNYLAGLEPGSFTYIFQRHLHWVSSFAITHVNAIESFEE
jgi:hypothetical protein